MSLVSPQKQRQRERRLHLWRLWNRGYRLRECVRQTATAFDCSERLIYYDWTNRHFWLAQEYALGSLDQFHIDMLAGMLETLREAQALAQDERAMANPAVRLGCLRLVHQIRVDILKHGFDPIHSLMRGKWTKSPTASRYIREQNATSVVYEDVIDPVLTPEERDDAERD
jgi:hypothetical protein